MTLGVFFNPYTGKPGGTPVASLIQKLERLIETLPEILLKFLVIP